MKKTSLADIANSLNVSKTLVSMVLNGRGNSNGISAETQRKVRAKAKELNYKPNRMARGLRTGKSHTVGLIVADISNSFYALLSRAVEEALSQRGYNLIICSSEENPQKEEDLIEMLQDRQVDGLLLASTQEQSSKIASLVTAGFPIVLVDRLLKEPDAAHVIADNFLGAFHATEHLIQNGCKRIAQITITPDHLTTMRDRKAGFKAALQENNFPLDSSLEKTVTFDKVKMEISGVLIELMEGEQPPDALFFGNNNLTVAGLESLRQMDVKAPDDVAIVSFDDRDLFKLIQPPLTALEQPVGEMGKAAGEMIVRMIEEKEPKKLEKITLPVKLMVRASSQTTKNKIRD